MRKALISLFILMPMLPACGPFVVGRPILTAQNAGCAGLLPQEWREGVPPADVPAAILEGNAAIADWVVLADAQTGRLDVANDRTRSAIGIVERCEERDRVAVRSATRRRFLGIF